MKKCAAIDVETVLGGEPLKGSLKLAGVLFGIPAVLTACFHWLFETGWGGRDALGIGILVAGLAGIIGGGISLVVVGRALYCFRRYSRLARGLEQGDIRPDFHLDPQGVDMGWLIIDLEHKTIHVNDHQWPVIALRGINKFNSARRNKYIELTFTGNGNGDGVQLVSLTDDARDAEFDRLLGFLRERCGWKSGQGPVGVHSDQVDLR